MTRKRQRSAAADPAKLASRRCLPNRYVHIPTLTKVGLYDDVVDILQSCGWTDLLEMRDATYPALVREFLSGFHFVDQQDDVDGEGKFRFKLRGRDVEMPLGTVRELFGWPDGGQSGSPPPQDGADAWREITGGEAAFDPGRSTESGMRNEVYCYLHRVISCTIYGRENGQEKVSKSDHDLLYYFHRRLPVDFARLLGLRLREIRDTDGPLVCGGFITRIVSGISGFNIERRYRGRLEPKLIDMSMLVRMRVIRVDEEADTVVWVHFKDYGASPPAAPVDHQQNPASGAVELENAVERSSQAIRELSRELDQLKKKLKTELHRMELNMFDFFKAISPGWQPPLPPSPPPSPPLPEE